MVRWQAKFRVPAATTYEFVPTGGSDHRIEVDGAPYTGTFTYDAANDTVTLDNPGFTGGEQVDIFYDVLSDC